MNRWFLFEKFDKVWLVCPTCLPRVEGQGHTIDTPVLDEDRECSVCKKPAISAGNMEKINRGLKKMGLVLLRKGDGFTIEKG